MARSESSADDVVCKSMFSTNHYKMSSNLLNAIPTLNGTNFLVWNQQMMSYLRSQGLYRTLLKSCPVQGKGTSDPDVTDVIEKWEDANSKAIGSMLLRLHFSIAYKH